MSKMFQRKLGALLGFFHTIRKENTGCGNRLDSLVGVTCLKASPAKDQEKNKKNDPGSFAE